MPCPNCGSDHNFPTPEKMWERFCGDCDFVWEISHDEEDY